MTPVGYCPPPMSPLVPLVLATLFVDLPLGPPAERAARELVRPWQLGEVIGKGPGVLWGMRVEARQITYEVGPPGGPAQARVIVHAEPGAGSVVVVDDEGSDTGAHLDACEALAAAVTGKLTSGAVVFRGEPAPEGAVNEPGAAPVLEPRPRGPPESGATAGQPDWAAFALLVALLLSVAVSLRGLRAGLPVAPRGSWGALALVVFVLAALLLFMPDVVAHHHGHGWDTVRAVAGGAGDASPFRSSNPYGPLAVLWTRLLSAGASTGHETFVASRVGAALSVCLTYVVALALTERPTAALASAGALAVQPALLYMGRAETLTAPGLALALLAATTCLLAARTGRLRLLVPASFALASLASFQLLGPVCAGPIGLLLFAKPASGDHGRRYLMAAVGAGAVAVALAAPHLLAMTAVIGSDAAQAADGGLPTTLLGASAWTPAGLRWVALAGAALLAWRRPVATLGLIALCVVALYGPIGAAHTWAAWPRYQLWALLPVALGVGVFVDAGGWRPDTAVSRSWSMAAVLIGGLALGLGLQLPAATLAIDHPEDVQLRAWRHATMALEEDAFLVVPASPAGQARASLPDVELLGARPDITLLDLAAWQDRGRPGPAWWFDPLYCHARYPGTPESSASECVAGRAEPRHVAALHGAATALDERYQDDGAVADWHLIPYPETVVPVGLFSLP